MTGERRDTLERYALTLTELLQRKRHGRALDELAVYLIDLLDPLGYAQGNALRARYGAPDPAVLIRHALGASAPVRPIALGMMKPAKLAEFAEAVAPGFERVAVQLRASELAPFLVRVMVVAVGGAELSHLQVIAAGQAMGVA